MMRASLDRFVVAAVSINQETLAKTDTDIQLGVVIGLV